MAGAAGREDGGAGEGRRRARPQWRSLSERKRAVAAGAEGGAGAPPRPCQRTCGGPVEGAAPRRATRRALTGPRRGPDARRSPAVPLRVARPRPAPLPRTRSVSPNPLAERAARSPPLLPRGHAGRGRRRCGAGLGWHVGLACVGSAAVGACHPRCQRAPSPARPGTGVLEGGSSTHWSLTRCGFCFFLSVGPYVRIGWVGFAQLCIFATKLIKVAVSHICSLFTL